MSPKPLHECHAENCDRLIREGTYCCRPCRRSEGEQHAVFCPGTKPPGGPRK